MKATFENLCKEQETIHIADLEKNKEQISELKGTVTKIYCMGVRAGLTPLRRESEQEGRSKKMPQIKCGKTHRE